MSPKALTGNRKTGGDPDRLETRANLEGKMIIQCCSYRVWNSSASSKRRWFTGSVRYRTQLGIRLRLLGIISIEVTAEVTELRSSLRKGKGEAKSRTQTGGTPMGRTDQPRRQVKGASGVRKLWPAGQIWNPAWFYKVLLEHSHTPLLTYCPRLLSQHNSKDWVTGA